MLKTDLPRAVVFQAEGTNWYWKASLPQKQHEARTVNTEPSATNDLTLFGMGSERNWFICVPMKLTLFYRQIHSIVQPAVNHCRVRFGFLLYPIGLLLTPMKCTNGRLSAKAGQVTAMCRFCLQHWLPAE